MFCSLVVGRVIAAEQSLALQTVLVDIGCMTSTVCPPALKQFKITDDCVKLAPWVFCAQAGDVDLLNVSSERKFGFVVDRLSIRSLA